MEIPCSTDSTNAWKDQVENQLENMLQIWKLLPLHKYSTYPDDLVASNNVNFTLKNWFGPWWKHASVLQVSHVLKIIEELLVYEFCLLSLEPMGVFGSYLLLYVKCKECERAIMERVRAPQRNGIVQGMSNNSVITFSRVGVPLKTRIFTAVWPKNAHLPKLKWLHSWS